MPAGGTRIDRDKKELPAFDDNDMSEALTHGKQQKPPTHVHPGWVPTIKSIKVGQKKKIKSDRKTNTIKTGALSSSLKLADTEQDTQILPAEESHKATNDEEPHRTVRTTRQVFARQVAG